MTDIIPFTEPVFTEQRDAVIGVDGCFRYWLMRRWAAHGKTLLFVMLNPSTADADKDDPTVLKCKRFAKIQGYTAIEIVNLYAYRTASPAELRAAGSPIGLQNDGWIARRARIVTEEGGRVCVAWGASAGSSPRARDVMRILTDVGTEPCSLHVTKDGHPGHPLYLSSMSGFTPFEYAEAAFA